MPFTYPNSFPLARRPTPIEKLDRLSQALEGPELYVKRDDLTGIGLTGNKVRKLEFLIQDALDKGCDTLITCGGLQSNHARATAITAAKLGLQCRLVLRDQTGGDLDGNLFLDRLVGAEITFISAEEYKRVDEVMNRLAESLRSEGRKPYIIPEGGSNELGALGYVRAVEELCEQLKTIKLRIDHVVTAVGSGGTQAGLLLGKMLYDLSAEIHGINVCETAEYFVSRIYGIIERARAAYGIDVTLAPTDVHVIDGYVGKGYALSRAEEIDTIKRVAKMEGLLLDPVYTGKAIYGLIDQIRKGYFKRGDKVLFWHTGGIFGLFPKRGLFF